MARIGLQDNIKEILLKMSDGNLGALTVMIDIYKNPQIDPDGFMGGLGTILMFDSLGLYGPEIWMLYKDVCRESISKTISILRGWQLGFISKAAIHQSLANPSILDVDSIYSQVKKRLPKFNSQEESDG